MPYKSKAQAAYMHIHHPEIATRWSKEYLHQDKLPEHVKKKKAGVLAIYNKENGTQYDLVTANRLGLLKQAKLKL